MTRSWSNPEVLILYIDRRMWTLSWFSFSFYLAVNISRWFSDFKSFHRALCSGTSTNQTSRANHENAARWKGTYEIDFQRSKKWRITSNPPQWIIVQLVEFPCPIPTRSWCSYVHCTSNLNQIWTRKVGRLGGIIKGRSLRCCLSWFRDRTIAIQREARRRRNKIENFIYKNHSISLFLNFWAFGPIQARKCMTTLAPNLTHTRKRYPTNVVQCHYQMQVTLKILSTVISWWFRSFLPSDLLRYTYFVVERRIGCYSC